MTDWPALLKNPLLMVSKDWTKRRKTVAERKM